MQYLVTRKSIAENWLYHPRFIIFHEADNTVKIVETFIHVSQLSNADYYLNLDDAIEAGHTEFKHLAEHQHLTSNDILFSFQLKLLLLNLKTRQHISKLLRFMPSLNVRQQNVLEMVRVEQKSQEDCKSRQHIDRKNFEENYVTTQRLPDEFTVYGPELKVGDFLYNLTAENFLVYGKAIIKEIKITDITLTSFLDSLIVYFTCDDGTTLQFNEASFKNEELAKDELPCSSYVNRLFANPSAAKNLFNTLMDNVSVDEVSNELDEKIASMVIDQAY